MCTTDVVRHRWIIRTKMQLESLRGDEFPISRRVLGDWLCCEEAGHKDMHFTIGRVYILHRLVPP